ncbi:MAG TPA: UDP-3-O-acyl-N-acetylglucosamine deacetylase [Syntrophorhabdaceae bacterium]|nr:UDP-3-O-acyl-N-acetylglucosamine deacetylase [Syntrophorhabdaceae bacterium]
MHKVLIIDDEKDILDTLSSILQDEGFSVLKAVDGEEGLAFFEREKPDIVLLDVWMPELDGIQVLKKIKEQDKDAIVIVISGHGTISTAVEAVKMGAFDFLEKPLSIDKVLEVVLRGLGTEYKSKGKTEDFKLKSSKGLRQLKQRTIGKSIVVYGVGLFSGVKTGMILLPVPENTGIVFEHIPDGERVPAYIDYAFSVGNNSSVKGKNCAVRTIEHLLSACHMCGITNLLVKVSEEIPNFDGSAIEICNKIEESGVVEQDEGIEPLRITERIELTNLAQGKLLSIEPSETFEVEYELEQAAPIGRQTYRFSGNRQSYVNDIAPARTFSFIKDFEQLAKKGLGSGGRVDNAILNVILLNDNGVINTKLRFQDEFVRHKILDLIGDIYLLNRPVLGKIRAKQTGHLENIALVKELKRRFL